MEVIMDDFLYNLRRDSDKRNRRNTNVQQQYRGPDRRGLKDKRNYHRKAEGDLISEVIPELKSLLETISMNQKRRADIEERKVEVLEKVSLQLEALLSTTGRDDISQKLSNPQDSEDARLSSVQNHSNIDRDEITKLVLDMRNKGKTYKEIARYLEDENIPTFSRKGEWHAQTIHKICKQVA